MPVRRLITALVLAAAFPGAAFAQYRPEAPDAGYRSGMPAVNPRPAEADPASGAIQSAAAFRAWYARAKRPSIMVFWNREQSDETTTEYAGVVATGEAAHVWSTRRGAAAEGASVTAAYREKINGGQYTDMDALSSAKLEAAFVTAWLQNGARLVDRAALVRNTSTNAARADRDDVQYLESVALKQGVQYLLEVLPTPQASSPTGWMFMVRVKHLPSARLVAQFNTQAAPPDGPERLVAAPGGFERRRTAGATNAEAVGAELAFQTMGRLR
jgi:hypothetical protein